MRKTLLIILFFLCTSCGTENIFSCPSQIMGTSCEEKSLEERVKDHIDQGEFDAAIALLEEEILARGTEDFSLHPLLATVYAYKMGINIYDIALSATDGGSVDSRELLATILPAPEGYTEEEYDALMSTLNDAIMILSSIPASYLEEEGHEAYRSSVEFQTSLYNSSMALMILNKYMVPTTTDGSDYSENDLENMTPSDAIAIVNALQAAAGEDGNPMASAAVKMLEKIEQAPGETTEEKIANYAESRS